ncbi:MAG: hypothetical protein ACRD3V_03905 [Vicinamibacteria bacterium]
MRQRPEAQAVQPTTVQDLVIQTAMAFGQGAVDRTVTPAGSHFLRTYFMPRFKEHLKHYQKHRLAILAYARGLGWYAGTLANSRRVSIIDAVDVRVALDKFPCPITPPILQFLEQLRGQEPGG